MAFNEWDQRGSDLGCEPVLARNQAVALELSENPSFPLQAAARPKCGDKNGFVLPFSFPVRKR